MPLYRPSELHAFLGKTSSKAKKSLSQNFLIDGNILRKILVAADVQKGDFVVEIGPGPGALTESLLHAGAHVLAIEMDKILSKQLARLQTPDKRLEIIEADVLEVDFEKILKSDQNAKIISNLPYHIVSPILEKILPLNELVSSLTLMVQKEYAIRMCAKTNCADYSPLTIFVQFYSTVHYCFTVKPKSFFPVPKVDSTVVRLDLKKPDSSVSPLEFFPFIKKAFQKRRKTLSSSLREYATLHEIQKELKDLGYNPQSRPEDLPLDAWICFFKRLFLRRTK